jgi:hypothetical protein
MNVEQAIKLLTSDYYTVKKNTSNTRNGIITVGINIIFYKENKTWGGKVIKVDRAKNKTYFTVENAVSDDLYRIRTFDSIESKDILEIIL